MTILETADRVLELAKSPHARLEGTLTQQALAEYAPVLAQAVKDQHKEIERLVDLLRPMAAIIKTDKIFETVGLADSCIACVTLGECRAAARAVAEFDKGKVT